MYKITETSIETCCEAAMVFFVFLQKLLIAEIRFRRSALYTDSFDLTIIYLVR